MLRMEGRRPWATGTPRFGGGGLNGADRPPARCRGLKLLRLRQMCRGRSQVNAPGFGRARKPEWCGGAPSRASDRREDRARGERRGSPGASPIFVTRKPRQRRAACPCHRASSRGSRSGGGQCCRDSPRGSPVAGTKEAMRARPHGDGGRCDTGRRLRKKSMQRREKGGDFTPKMRAPGVATAAGVGTAPISPFCRWFGFQASTR
jgi:hypothetical protein